MTAVIHVAPLSGDDVAGGTDRRPVRTIGRAIDLARELGSAVVIELAAGNHVLEETLRLDERDDGLTIRSSAGHHAIVSGGRRLTGWVAATFQGQPCYAVTVGDLDARQLFVDGRRARRPRVPHDGYFRFTGLDGQEDSGHRWLDGPIRAEFAVGDLEDWRNKDDVELQSLQLWFDTHHRIASIDFDRSVVTFRSRSLGSLIDETGRFARYAVENVAEAFGHPGDWYHDRPTGQLYYRPLEGQDMSSVDIVVPVLERLLELRRCRNVRLERLTFEHSEWHLPADDPGFIQAAFGVPGAIAFDGSADCTLVACEIRHVAQYGVEMLTGSTRNALLGCEIHDVGAGAVKIGHDGYDHTDAASRSTVVPSTAPMGAVVSDCWLHDTGKLFAGSVAVWIGNSGGNRVVHNEIRDVPYTGISCGWSWGYAETLATNNVIADNHIHHIGMERELSDNGAVYLLGIAPGTRIARNHIHDVGRYGYGGWGIYADEGTSEVVIEGNLTHDTDAAGMRIHYGRDIWVHDNVFAFSGEGHLSLGKLEAHMTARFERNVVMWGSGDIGPQAGGFDPAHQEVARCVLWRADGEPVLIGGRDLPAYQAEGRFLHSVVADPRFRASELRDFTFADDSPAREAGILPVARTAGPRFADLADAPPDAVADEPDARPIVRSDLTLVGSTLTLRCANAGDAPAHGVVAIRHLPDAAVERVSVHLAPGAVLTHDLQLSHDHDGRYVTDVEGDGFVPTSLVMGGDVGSALP